MHWILAYGALAHRKKMSKILGREVNDSNSEFVRLFGYQRAWNVAYDNLEPAGRYYECPFSKERIEGAITFLNVEPCQGSAIDCVAIKVTEEELALLDKRESRYDRTKIKKGIMGSVNVSGNVWIYIATPVAVRCFNAAKEEDQTVVAASYLRTVQEAYIEFGFSAYKRYLASTEECVSEVRELVAKLPEPDDLLA